MNLPQCIFTPVHWLDEPVDEHAGETGMAYWRTRMIGDVRVRLVEYSPGYVADHWCERGHILFVAEGELTSELRDGRAYRLVAGSGYMVSNEGDSPHRSVTAAGAKVFIVD